MDESLFLFSIFCGFLIILSLIWCFLSTCLGIPLRRADLRSAFSFPTPASVRARDARNRQRLEERQRLGLSTGVDGGLGGADASEGYEMSAMGVGMGVPGRGVEEWEGMKRGGGRMYY